MPRADQPVINWGTAALLMFGLLLSGCGEKAGDDSAYWTMHVIEEQVDGADGVDLFDIDSDGDLDALSSWEESAQVLLHENPGAEFVTSPWQRTSVNGGLSMRKVEDARYADFTDDGLIDAVVTATENHSEKVGVHWLFNPESPFEKDSWRGTWIGQGLKFPFIKVAIGQIDGRGALDIAAGSKNDTGPASLVWYQAPDNPGVENARQWQGHVIADIEWTDTLEILDINADGANDVLLGYWQHLAWYENPGNLSETPAAWTEHIISNTTKAYFTRCDGSEFADSKLRLVAGADLSSAVAGDTVAWLVSKQLDEQGNWLGGWLQQPITTPDPIPRDKSQQDYKVKSMACGNIDSDPRPDIVVSMSGFGHGVFALMNLADATDPQSLRLKTIASARFNSRKGIKFDDVRLADLDLDGDLDIVTTEENGSRDYWWSTRGLGLIWYENPGLEPR